MMSNCREKTELDIIPLRRYPIAPLEVPRLSPPPSIGTKFTATISPTVKHQVTGLYPRTDVTSLIEAPDFNKGTLTQPPMPTLGCYPSLETATDYCVAPLIHANSLSD